MSAWPRREERPFIIYHCAECDHIVVARSRPSPIYWQDAHICQDWIPESENKEEQNV